MRRLCVVSSDMMCARCEVSFAGKHMVSVCSASCMRRDRLSITCQTRAELYPAASLSRPSMVCRLLAQVADNYALQREEPLTSTAKPVDPNRSLTRHLSERKEQNGRNLHIIHNQSLLEQKQHWARKSLQHHKACATLPGSQRLVCTERAPRHQKPILKKTLLTLEQRSSQWERHSFAAKWARCACPDM